MPLLKSRVMQMNIIICLIYFGGQWTQSTSNFSQGFGFITIVIALICLYIIFKLMSGTIGKFFKFTLFLAVCFYFAYSLGLFDENVRSSFLNGKSTADSLQKVESSEERAVDDLAEQMFGGDQDKPLPTTNQKTDSSKDENNDSFVDNLAKNGGIIGKIKTLLFGKNENDKAENHPSIGNINPTDYPSIEGEGHVISGSVLLVNGLFVKLLGIEAPDPQQTCANRYGAGYYCGQEAIIWLQNWLNERPVRCHVLGDVINQWATGICFVEEYKYDVAAVVVNAGWAVAYTKNTDVYVPYEQQAAENKRGLWQGSFYKPWDWRKIQNRKVDIQINYDPPKANTSSGSDSFFDFDFNFKKLDFLGLF